MAIEDTSNSYEYKLKQAGLPEPLSTYLSDPLDVDRLKAGFVGPTSTGISEGSIPASYFGFAAGQDNTQAFVTLNSWMDTKLRTQRFKITFGPGVFYADKIVLTAFGTTSQRGHLTIEGCGQYATTFKPNTSSNPIFFQTGTGAFTGLVIRNIGIEGIGSSNPEQHGFFMGGDLTPLYGHDGGTWNALIEDVRIEGFDGTQSIIRGCNNDSMLPQQFLTFTNYFVYRKAGNHNPNQLIWGQAGQFASMTSMFSGESKTNNAGPNLWVARDPRLFGTSASVTTNTISLSATVPVRNAQRIRIVGATLPSTLSTGTDYYTSSVSNSGTGTAFKLSSSAANAASSTTISIPDAGTVGAWYIVDADLTPLSVNVTTDEFTTRGAHLLFTGDGIKFIGTNLPSPLVHGTDYYVIKTGDKTLKVATTYANAVADVKVSIDVTTAGTIGNYGIAISNTVPNTQQPYAIDFINTTLQAAETGVMIDGANNVHIAGYLERLVDGINTRYSGTCSADHLAIGVVDNLFVVDGGNSNIYVDAQSTITGGFTNIVKSTNKGKVVFGSRPATSQNTTGAGVTAPWNGQTVQVGAASEINMDTYTMAILNSSATVISNIKSRLVVGEKITLRPFGAGYSAFISSGNIDLNGITTEVRFPEKSTLTFELRDLVTQWTLVNAQLPWHTATWTVSGNVAANASITTTIAAPGAQIGDPSPQVSINAALTSGLIITGEVTATDVVTVKITNPTVAALLGPTNPSVKVRQVR